MKTRITTIEEAAAIVGRMVYVARDDGRTQRLSDPLEVCYVVVTTTGTFIAIGGVMLNLPVTVEVVTAQPEANTGGLATWDSTVLPALRRAMAEHPVLRGAGVKLEGEGSTLQSFSARITYEGGSYASNVRRGPLVADIEKSCVRLATNAADAATRASEEARTASGVDLGARALREELCGPAPAKSYEERVWDAVESTPIEHESPPCAGLSKPTEPPPEIRVGSMVIPQRFEGMPDGMAPLVGKAARVTDLREGKGGLLAAVAGWCWPLSALRLASESRPASERTPLPQGWTWGTLNRCAAHGPGGAFAVLCCGADTSHIETLDNKPPRPDVLAALRTEAQRLGLPWVEPGAPEGYSFGVDDIAAYVGRVGRPMPNGSSFQCYWAGDDASYMRENTDGQRWPPELEPARQHAARLLGHEAPPIRLETMEPDDPRASGPLTCSARSRRRCGR